MQEWRGKLSETASLLLRQFAAHRGLRSAVTDVCLWSVYSAVLHRRTLDFNLVLSLLQRLRKAITGAKLPEEELNAVFWTASESFLSAVLSIVRHVRDQSDLCTNPSHLTALLE